MLKTLTMLLLVAVPAGASQFPEYIAISKSNNESQLFFPGWRTEAPFLPLIEIDLDLGDSIEGQSLTIGGQEGENDTFRVHIQYQTSITVMNEGPHLDLLNWKHYTSKWHDTERVSSIRFTLPVFTEAQTSMFPDVTILEIQEAVLASGGDRWANLVQGIRGPRDHPAGVGLSAIWVRIQIWKQEAWTTLTTLVVYPPMGC